MSQRHTLNASARRERARQEAERIQRQQRRRRGLLVLGAVLTVALLVTAGLIIWQGSQQSYLDAVERAPAGADASGGIPVAADGSAGSANPSAPRLDLYLDIQSPESVAFWEAQAADLQALNADGTVALWMHLVGFVDGGAGGASTRAGEAAAVVADRAPEQYMVFVDAELVTRAGGAEQLNDPDLEAMAFDVGVPRDVIEQFTDNLFDEWFGAATDQARRDGVETVPTVLLEGEPLTADWSVDGALEVSVTSALAG